MVVVDKACGLKRALNDSEFLFLLNYFYKTLLAVHVLPNHMQKKNKSRLEFVCVRANFELYGTLGECVDCKG